MIIDQIMALVARNPILNQNVIWLTIKSELIAKEYSSALFLAKLIASSHFSDSASASILAS